MFACSINLQADTYKRIVQRSPMQWSDAENAGFAKPGVKPWLLVNTNFYANNVEVNTLIVALELQYVISFFFVTVL